MKRLYTKKEIIVEFKELFSVELDQLKKDIPAKRMLWHNYTDMLCKDGHITPWQYNNWSNIF